MPLDLALRLAAVPRFNGRTGPEGREAIAFAADMRRRMIEGARSMGPWCHIPNEGRRSRIAAAKLRAEGMISGMPDYILPAPGSLMIELKATTKQTEAQLDVEAWASLFGINYRVARSAAEAIKIVDRWQEWPFRMPL
ncbi:MAG: hypothetical protein R3C70_07135 [Geminicoccaceae bacterium]